MPTKISHRLIKYCFVIFLSINFPKEISYASAGSCTFALSPSNCQLEEYNSYSNYGYNVYVIVDDNSFTPPSKYSHLCIQINDDQCIRRGFVNFNPAIRKHSRCSAWDKAVYALSYLICDYKQCWIIEEDVFIPSPGSLIGIDSDFPDADLLASPVFLSADFIYLATSLYGLGCVIFRQVPFCLILPTGWYVRVDLAIILSPKLHHLSKYMHLSWLFQCICSFYSFHL